MILKGISVNQNPPTKDYLWITPKGNTRFWDQSTWRLIGGSGDTEGSGFLSTALFNTYINGDTNYLAKFTGPHTLNHSFLKIGYNSGSNENYLEFGTTDNVSSRIYYDATHKALRVTGGIYADWVSALGPNGEIGSGGSSNAIDWTALGTEGNEIIHASHIPDLSSIYQLKLPTTGNVLTTYAINISGNASTATSATSATSAGKWTTARTFKIKDIASNYGSNVSVDGSSSTYELPMPANIEVTSLIIGNAKLTFDDSSGVNMLKIDGVSGQTFNGIYSTKAVSALGGNPLNGTGGSSGIDWGALGTYDNNSNHKINVGYLDGVINTSNIPDIYQTKLTYSNGLYAISISGNASTATYATSAGSATTATTATKLGSSTVGSLTKGIYLSSGTPTACSYNLQANVSAGTDNSIAYYSVNSNVPTLNYSNVIKYLNDNNSLSKQRRGFQIAATCVGNTQTDLVSDTTGKLSYGDGGPQIVFDESNTFSGQPGALIYTTHDYAGFGSTWHFVSSQNDWNVISKRFHARTGLSVGDDLPPGRSGNSSLWSTLQNYNLYVNGKTYLTNELRIGDAIVKWENGGLHIYNSTSGNTAGIYADWVSALGANPNTGSGSTGDMDWGTLTTTNENYNISGTDSQRHIIHSTFLPLGYIQNNRNYPVQTDNNKLYVNVPWTDNDTTYKLTLNGTQYGSGSTSLGSFFAPTQVGSNGYILKSNGSGVPSWVAQSSLSVGSASKLTTARKTYVTLGTASTTTTRDWSGDTTIPVNGILSVANGGTGANNLNNFRILDKGTLITASSENKKDFNDYREKGTFYSTGGYGGSTTFDNMLNKPEGTSGGFKLVVENLDDVINGDLSDPTSGKTGYLKQTLYFKNNKQYSRILYYTKDTSVTPNIYVDNWTSWIKNITSLDLGSQNRIVKFGSNTLSNSIIYENNNKIGINNSAPDCLLTVSGDARISNSLIIGTTSSGAKISWDSDNGGLKVERMGTGTAGLYADWISALGANSSGGGSGSGGLDIPTLWSDVLTQSDGGLSNYQGEKINSNLIPILSVTDKTSGTLPVGRGGTGSTTFISGYLLTGNGTSAIQAYQPSWQSWVEGTSAGPKAKIKLGNVDYTSAAIPSASDFASGIVTTGTQTFSGEKSFTGWVNIKNTTTNGSGFKVYFTDKSINDPYTVIYSYRDANYGGRIRFREHSEDSSGTRLSYYENYDLPKVTQGRTGNATYSILTSKSAVTIAQGGTGATSAKGAEYNILSEASTALETGFNDTTRFAIERINPSAANGILCGYRTASQLWSYIKGKMSSDSAVNISGNAATATILQTTRTINGTNFNGSANITTSTWGTSRNISISDADGTNTGDAVSVNGSENKTLKLPSTIKASLNGTVNGYSISSTINGGAANRLAYYTSSGIDDASTIYASNTKLAINSTSEPSYNLYVNGTSYFNSNVGIGDILQNTQNLILKSSQAQLRLISFSNGENYIESGNTSWSASANLHISGYNDGSIDTLTLKATSTYISGNVGIGNTSPAYKLDVKGDSYSVLRLLRNHASYGASIRFENNSGLLGSFGYDGSGYYAWTDSSGNNKMILKSDGTLGVNTTQPSSECKLHVNGNIYATGGVTALQAVSSDKRLKKNIKKFNAKDIVDKLNPVSFEWNSKAKKLSDFKDGTNYGLIAQDSDGIIDNLVFDLPNGKGYKGVRYEKLIPILLQAVKEQQKEIDELKQIIKKLKV